MSHCVRPNFKSFKWIIFIGCVFHDYQTMFLSLVEVLCSPMLLSTFSHFSLFHMAANMYVLWSFSSSIVNILGQEQFMAVYLSAGVISNFVSYVCKVATRRYGPSLGASRAIMMILAAVRTKIPEGRLAIIYFQCSHSQQEMPYNPLTPWIWQE